MAIKRHKTLYALSHDHHHGLLLAQLIKKDAPEYEHLPKTLESKKEYTLKFYKSDLIKHFSDEEKILFPVVKGRDSNVDEQIVEIISEHRKIEDLIKKISEQNASEELLDELGNILEQHIRKEERKLFQDIQEILSENELETVSEKIQKSRE